MTDQLHGTQAYHIMRHMVDHGSISRFEARDSYGCERLAARIKDLREKGIKIKTTVRTYKNAKGRTTRYAIYSLEEPEMSNRFTFGESEAGHGRQPGDPDDIRDGAKEAFAVPRSDRACPQAHKGATAHPEAVQQPASTAPQTPAPAPPARSNILDEGQVISSLKHLTKEQRQILAYRGIITNSDGEITAIIRWAWWLDDRGAKYSGAMTDEEIDAMEETPLETKEEF